LKSEIRTATNTESRENVIAPRLLQVKPAKKGNARNKQGNVGA
jgi:hypothetical protein